MKAWSQWQDWLKVVVGVYLFISPWILGFGAVSVAAWSGWILGTLVFTLGLWALAYPQLEVPEWCGAVMGVAYPIRQRHLDGTHTWSWYIL